MKKQTKRTLMFYVMMAVAMALPLNSFAQEKRGLFGSSNEANKETTGGMLGGGGLRGTSNIGTNPGNQPGNQPFGIDPTTAPLGSGVAMLIAAGAGYALLKSKRKNNK